MGCLPALNTVAFIYLELDHQAEGGYNCNLSLSSHALDMF